jgi:hypothetical protein
LGELRDRPGPGQKARLKTFGIEARKDAAEGIVRGNPMGQSQEGLEPHAFALPKEFHILEPFTAGQQGAHGDHQDIQQEVLRGPCNPWVL